MSELTKLQEKSAEKHLSSQKHSLVLYNDDHNSFDFVIETLVDICEHDVEQAEQCALLTHYKGKCAVLSGSYEELKQKREMISERGLTIKLH